MINIVSLQQILHNAKVLKQFYSLARWIVADADNAETMEQKDVF